MAHHAIQPLEKSYITQSKPNYVAVNEDDQDPEFQHQQRSSNHDSSSAAPSEHWRPFSLRPIVLTLFAIVLVFILAALIAIWFIAREHQGLNLLTENHYTWTYGPTAVFVIVISYWRLIDYHLKALTPWQELQDGPVAADRSILLDYISPFLLTTIASAAKRRHYIVLLTIVGFLILKVVTIASTGLFFPSTITVGPFDAEMVQTSQFDTITNFTDFYDPGASPFYNAYAVMEKGLPLPEGLTTTLLYETFKPAPQRVNPNATYSVKSRAFEPLVTCELMDIQLPINEDDFGSGGLLNQQLQIQNTSEWTCSLENGLRDFGANLKVIDVATCLTPPRQLLTSFGQFDCKRPGSAADTGSSPFLIAVSDVRYNQTYNTSIAGIPLGETMVPESWDFAISKITGMLCSVDYEMKDVSVFYNLSHSDNLVQRVEVLGQSNPVKMANVSIDYLSAKLRRASPEAQGGARDMFGLTTQFEYVEQPPHTVLTMVAHHVKADYIHLLNNPEDFLAATEYVLNGMLLQIAKEKLVIPDTNSTFRQVQSTAQEYHTEEKLVVQFAPFVVMVVGISILVLMTVAVINFGPKVLMSHNPEAISAAAEVLTSSKEMHDMLKQLKTSAEKSASNILEQARYHMNVLNHHAIISPQTIHPNFQAHHHNEDGLLNTYTKFTLSKFYLAVTLLSAPATIAVLEILQHLSDSGFPGIATIHDVNSLKVSFYTSFLPAIVALLIATMFNCLDFNTAVLAPYSKMSVRPGSYEDLRTPPLAHMPPVALFKSFRCRYWAALLTGIGALVGSVLTIVVSGLFTIERVPNMLNVSLSHTDSWNMSYVQGLSTDNAAAAVSSLIESANLSYPQFTYDELAFPSLTVNNDQSFEDLSGFMSVNVPALRAELVCEELPWSTSNASVQWHWYKDWGWPAIKFNVTIPLPETCHYGSCHGNESTLRVTLSEASLQSNDNTTYYGQAVDIHTGPWHSQDKDCNLSFTESGSVSAEYADQPINQPGCPTMAVVYGYFNGNDTSKSTWTTLLCEQRIQEVNTSVIVSSPDVKIQPDPPPKPDELKAKYLTSDENVNDTTFGWWHSTDMDNSYVIFNKSAIDPVLLEMDDTVSNGSPQFSNFFRGAFFGRTPLPVETLQKNDTNTRALVFDHIQMFYRRYMAQYISSNLRVNATGTSATNMSKLARRADNIVDTPSITGSLIPDGGVTRLVQHRTPKLVMQIILAIMFLCGISALCVGRYHDVVLWNPCTVAGVMVLFAGSRMCQFKTDSDEVKQSDSRSLDHTNHSSQESMMHEMRDVSMSVLWSHKGKRGSEYLYKGVPTLVSDDLGLSGGASSASGRDWQERYRHARFRLGWWRDGVYMGSKKKMHTVESDLDREGEEGGRWRYGIDASEQ